MPRVGGKNYAYDEKGKKAAAKARKKQKSKPKKNKPKKSKPKKASTRLMY